MPAKKNRKKLPDLSRKVDQAEQSKVKGGVTLNYGSVVVEYTKQKNDGSAGTPTNK